MKWNVDFTIAALIFDVLMLAFYSRRTKLPTKKNRYFNNAIILSLAAACLNIGSAFLNSRCNRLNVGLLYFVDISNYIVYSIALFCLYVYAMALVGKPEKKPRWFKAGLVILLLFDLYVLTTPLTHFVFYYDEAHNFTRGLGYPYMCFWPIYYALDLFYNTYKMREYGYDKSNKTELICAILASVCVILGNVLIQISSEITFVDLANSLALFFMYMGFENPADFISPITNTYNSKAFHVIVNEKIFEQKRFYCVGVVVSNYQSASEFYGAKYMDGAMQQLSQWIKEENEDSYVFYIPNGTIVVLRHYPFDIELFTNKVNERFDRVFEFNGTEMYLLGTPFVVKNVDQYDDSGDLISVIHMSSFSNLEVNEKGYLLLDDNVRKAFKREKDVQNAIYRAIKNESVLIYAQPLFNTKTKKISSAEILCRIIDSELGFLSPVEFITLAERNGQIRELGKQIFEKTCQFVKRVDLNALGIESLHVNLSPIQCLDRSLIDTYYKIAMSYEIDFSIFDFEITETDQVTTNIMQLQLDRIIQYGATVSLDDFGTGSSNLTRLLSYPLDIAKLDMSLVWDYFEHKNTIMLDSISVFKKENLAIVAEGVETKEMVDTLSELEVEYLQGYYFSKPIPLDEFVTYVTKFNEVK